MLKIRDLNEFSLDLVNSLELLFKSLSLVFLLKENLFLSILEVNLLADEFLHFGFVFLLDLLLLFHSLQCSLLLLLFNLIPDMLLLFQSSLGLVFLPLGLLHYRLGLLSLFLVLFQNPLRFSQLLLILLQLLLDTQHVLLLVNCDLFSGLSESMLGNQVSLSHGLGFFHQFLPHYLFLFSPDFKLFLKSLGLLSLGNDLLLGLGSLLKLLLEFTHVLNHLLVGLSLSQSLSGVLWLHIFHFQNVLGF